MKACQPQVGEKLFLVNRENMLNGFDFDDDRLGKNQVGAESGPHGNSFIKNWDFNLSFEWDSGFRQFVGEHLFIAGFEKARAKCAVDFKGDVEKCGGKLIFFFHGIFSLRLFENRPSQSVRCDRCVAVRKKEKKVSHGGTAFTALLEEGEKRFGRCVRCVAVREKEEEGVSRRHSEHSEGREL